MPASLRPQRARMIIDLLMETKKSYTLEELAAHFKWNHKEIVDRSMDILLASGVVDVDRTRLPHLFKWNGKPPTIWPAFVFNDSPQTELAIRETCEELLSKSKDYKLPPIDLSRKLLYAALFGMELEDSDQRLQYDEWLAATATKLRRYYFAYRVIKTIQEMPVKDRNLERWGVTNRLPHQDRDDAMSMSLVFQQMFNDLIAEIP